MSLRKVVMEPAQGNRPKCGLELGGQLRSCDRLLQTRDKDRRGYGRRDV